MKTKILFAFKKHQNPKNPFSLQEKEGQNGTSISRHKLPRCHQPNLSD